MGFIHSSSGMRSLQGQSSYETSGFTPSGAWSRPETNLIEQASSLPEPSKLWQGFAWTLVLGVVFWTMAGLLITWLV